MAESAATIRRRTRLPAGPQPPVAPRRPRRIVARHGVRSDDYYWMRDDSRTRADVLGYLRSEAAYSGAVLAHLKPLQESLHAEMIARIKHDDASVPWRKHGHWYYSRYARGLDHPIHVRRQGSMESPEQVMLDVNQLAAGRDYFTVDELSVSPDGQWLAWAEDAVGRGQFVVRIKHLPTGEVLPERIENTEPEVEWAADNSTFLYIAKDPETLLGFQVRKHVLRTDPAADTVVWEQADDSFYTGIGKTKDDRFLLITTQSTVSSECWYASADDPTLAFQCFLPRARDHEYQVEHFQDRWIVRTNADAPNFRLCSVPFGAERQRDAWTELVPHDSKVFLHGFDVFRRFLAIEERVDGLRQLRLQPWARGEVENGVAAIAAVRLPAPDPCFAMFLGQNEELDVDRLRYSYTSLTNPTTILEYDAITGATEMLRREPVLGSFDSANYRSEWRWVTARDGARVPVSLVYRADTPRDGSAPLLQVGYGAYGISQDPVFSTSLLSLLDRGFICATAHVRGGQELGRSWYDAGRLLNKRNSFSDFIDVSDWLVQERYADPQRLFAMGGSAGGLLVAGCALQAPQRYRAIVALVPFVDVLTSMLDETIPLTTNEYDEWGDPRLAAHYAAIRAWSPYDNIERREYPAMYIATGLWDSQVQYWEPAKFVARLRALKTDSRLIVLHVDLDAGHGGKSGRLQHYREVAEQWAFLLDQSNGSAALQPTAQPAPPVTPR